MKRIYLLAFSLLVLTAGYSQSGNYTKGKAFGFSFFLSNYEAASVLRHQGVVELFKDNNLFRMKDLNPGLALNYYQGLNNHMDFAASLGGSFLDYPKAVGNSNLTNIFFLEGTGQVNFKLLSDHYAFTPYADLGVGASQFKGNFGAFLPTGIGFQVNILDQFFIHLNSQYRIPVTEKMEYHFYHSLGFSGLISPKKQEPVKKVEIPVVNIDKDGDGIVDSLDRCPDVPGLAALNGCPDKDGDGIADIDDKCPDVPGIAKYQGCPIPDSDGDGINDEEDKCPNVPGVARYQGCPVPDSDGDGVNDEEDKCPNEVGPASNHGCPVIDVKTVEKVNKAAENIFFPTNSFTLLAKSFKTLNEVVQIMNDNPSYKISIDGYTDNTGKPEYNQKLSESRANSVKEYLAKKGISEERITSAGHGINDPVASNSTAAGRAKNRRVEMKLTNY